jgi:hypothetical protein
MGTAVILFALAALGGALAAGIRLSGKPYPPLWLALVHGVVAAGGLGVLIYTAATAGLPPLGQAALGVFVLASVGGAILFLGFHLRNKALPIPLVLGHGLAAVTGFVLLLIAYFGAG